MELSSVRVKTKYHTSNLVYKLHSSQHTVVLGSTGFGIAIDPYNVETLDQHGYMHLNNLVLSLPAIPVIHKERLLVISTNIEAVYHGNPTTLVTPESTHILSKMVSKAITVPKVLNMDMSRCMVPVLTDTAGKVYMSTTAHKVLYVTNSIEAQATIMQIALPLPDELEDLGRRFVRAVLPPDAEDKEEYYIYMKDRFINVF